jgi:transcriptional regulator with GAF, ATPase, and Fis domain
MNSAQDVHGSDSPKAGLIKLREAFEKRIILNVLEASQWNQSEAAKILKVNHNLIQKARQFRILIRNRWPNC